MSDGDADITMLLHQARDGDALAVAQLYKALYPELRRIARRRLVRNVRNTYLDTTALVNECYLKFAGSKDMKVEDRAHFLAYSAQAMRTIVVDFARARLAKRRGGGAMMMTLNSIVIAGAGSGAGGEGEVLAVHEALDELALIDGRLARVVEMRYFGGLDDAEIAEVMNVSVRTVRRDWVKARLLLSASLEQR